LIVKVDILTTLFFSFVLHYAITRIHINGGGLILNGTCHFSVILRESI